MNIVRHSAPSDRPASKLSLYAGVAVVSIVISLSAQAEEKTMSRSSNPPVLSHANVQTVAPALEKYMQGLLLICGNAPLSLLGTAASLQLPPSLHATRRSRCHIISTWRSI